MEAMEIDQVYEDPLDNLKGILNSRGLIELVCDYLTLTDMKSLRQVNKLCNLVLNNHSGFAEKCEAVFSKKWHSCAVGMNLSHTIRWKHVMLKKFVYCRNAEAFKFYWPIAAQNVTQLIITNTSMECDGFAYILNKLPKLSTLILSGAKLRDLDNNHKVLIQPNAVTPPFEEPLRHLTIENTALVEECFFEYLKNRTGQLESFAVKFCYESGQIRTPFSSELLRQRIGEFVTSIVDITRINATTLTKFTCENNQIISANIFNGLRNIPQNKIKDLCYSFSDDKKQNIFQKSLAHDISEIKHFIETNASQLKNVCFTFHGKISNDDLTKLIEPMRSTLESLKLAFCGAGEDRTEGISLAIINGMPKLESLEIADNKAVNQVDIQGYRSNKTDTKKAELLKKMKSSINVGGLLPFLPPQLKELIIAKLICTNVIAGLTDDEQTNVRNSFGNLTRLEIRDHISDEVSPILDIIFHEVKKLQTLVLSNCAVTDSHFTGLSPEAVQKNKSHADLVRIAENPTPNVIKIRPLFSIFPHLNHLDLSGNKISDLSMAATNCPGLLTLNISQCKITDIGLGFISQNLPKLKLLNLRGCRTSKEGQNRVILGCPKLFRIYASKSLNDAANVNIPLSPNFADIVKYQNPKNTSSCGTEIDQEIQVGSGDVME